GGGQLLASGGDDGTFRPGGAPSSAQLRTPRPGRDYERTDITPPTRATSPPRGALLAPPPGGRGARAAPARALLPPPRGARGSGRGLQVGVGVAFFVGNPLAGSGIGPACLRAARMRQVTRLVVVSVGWAVPGFLASFSVSRTSPSASGPPGGLARPSRQR